MDWSEEYKPSKRSLLFVFRVGGKSRVANRRGVIWRTKGIVSPPRRRVPLQRCKGTKNRRGGHDETSACPPCLICCPPRTPLRETPPRCLYQCFRRAKSERSCDFFRGTLPLLPSKYGGAAQFNFRACSCKLWWPVVNVGAGLCARPRLAEGSRPYSYT